MKVVFATNINKTNLNGIIDIENPRVLCYCNEGQSYAILEAFKNSEKVIQLNTDLEKLKMLYNNLQDLYSELSLKQSNNNGIFK